MARQIDLMAFISRGFRGKRRDNVSSSRVPPGQHVVTDFPVLSAGPTPRASLDEWTFSIDGEIDEPKRWTWEEFRALASETVTKDIHCVTKWSKLDTSWTGVSVDTLLEGVESATRRGSYTKSTAGRSTQSTVVRRACSCHTSISGRARNGFAA
jgi:DMSO/TMAO reductase YedYZ molybdopterin-dependent catalytic subunit